MNALQKPILNSIRSFRPSAAAISRTISTTLFEVRATNASDIKRTIQRCWTINQLNSVASFATSGRMEGIGDSNLEDEDHSDHHREHQFMTGPNPGLASVISQGIKTLEQTAEEIQYKTRKISLSRPHKKPSFKNGRADEMDPRQLAEGQRILDVASECLEQLAFQDEQNGRENSGKISSSGLILFGEPIVLLECEVNRNVRQAKIYYTLPYGILLDNRIDQRLYQEIMMRVQKELVQNGGAKLLARNVHTRLSHYYPPRIKLFPATDEMMQAAIEEFMT